MGGAARGWLGSRPEVPSRLAPWPWPTLGPAHAGEPPSVVTGKLRGLTQAGGQKGTPLGDNACETDPQRPVTGLAELRGGGGDPWVSAVLAVTPQGGRPQFTPALLLTGLGLCWLDWTVLQRPFWPVSLCPGRLRGLSPGEGPTQEAMSNDFPECCHKLTEPGRKASHFYFT